MLVTTLVEGFLYDPNGDPLANTPVTIRLTKREIEDNIVVPQIITVTTDPDGFLSVPLWPNTRGIAGSEYRLTVKTFGLAGERKLIDELFTVPEQAQANIVDLFNLGPPDVESVSAALRARQEAEAARDAAQVASSAASASAAQAEIAAVNTEELLQDTIDQVAIGAGILQQTEAARDAAEGFRDEAEGFRDQSVAARDAAQLAATQSQASAVTSGQNAAEALTFRNEAQMARDIALANSALTAADRLATAADRVQTGLDRDAAAASALAALTSEQNTDALYLATVQAVAAGGVFFGTYGEAQAALGTLEPNDILTVLRDETFGNRRTFYRVEMDAFEKNTLDIDFLAGIDARNDGTGRPSLDANFVDNEFSAYTTGFRSRFDDVRDETILADFQTNTFGLQAPAGGTQPAFVVTGNYVVGYPYEFVAAEQFNLVDAPLTSTDPALVGDLAIDGDYLYVATGVDAWKRITLETF